MRVFVTGASGHIGSALAPELRTAGHEVLGLARSDASAEALRNAGAEIVRGILEDLDVLWGTAAEADGVIHLAYLHRAPAHVDAAVVDLGAINTIGDALAGSGKPFVGTSGTLVLPPGRPGTERDEPDPSAPAARRVPAERAAVAKSGPRSSVSRLPCTAPPDRHGFVPTLIGIARRTGVSAFIGDDTNRWPAVHTKDAARLFRPALEAASTGARWHGAADAGVPFRDIAEVIGRRLSLPVVSLPPEWWAGSLGQICGGGCGTTSAVCWGERHARRRYGRDHQGWCVVNERDEWACLAWCLTGYLPGWKQETRHQMIKVAEIKDRPGVVSAGHPA
ncbi:SDR family oxidoreductase [Streptomyces sp. NPDC004538]|uniref:SDR family oxidoreductase n=1 Tax=Streptomyces sp. NPDC004538 TaxID=3154279 RepID=UPI0033B4921E